MIKRNETWTNWSTIIWSNVFHLFSSSFFHFSQLITASSQANCSLINIPLCILQNSSLTHPHPTHTHTYTMRYTTMRHEQISWLMFPKRKQKQILAKCNCQFTVKRQIECKWCPICDVIRGSWTIKFRMNRFIAKFLNIRTECTFHCSVILWQFCR